MKNWFLLSFFCVCLAVFYWAIFIGELPEEGEDEESALIVLSDEQLQEGGIAFDQVKTHTVEQALPIYGKIAIIPDHHCHITCKSSGTIKKAFKNLGDKVSQGEAIALIESKELAEAQAQFHISHAKTAMFQSLFEKEAKLSQKNLGTHQEYGQALANLQQAEIEKQTLEQKLHIFGLTPNTPPIYEVKAPFNGMIIKRFVTMGQAVSEGEELYEVANLDNVWGEFTVYPQDVHLLDLGKEIIVQDGQGSTVKGVIGYISPLINEETGTIVFLANIENKDGKWRPGSNVQGKLIVDTIEITTCVPAQSVVIIDGIPHIFIAHDEGIEPRKVLIGAGDNNFTEIVAGANEGENVVSANATLLKCEMTKQEPD